ncbi:MAG: redoxin domain-containing protein [Gammaproteobacteria bacterium]|nr:redoxin domain-containing protein [Gammaproteobacteria bacterium]
MSLPKTRRLLATVLFCLGLTQVAYADQPIAGDFILPTTSGNVSLAQHRNEVVYLDFWASWCTPCRKSFPWMNEMTKRYGKQGLTIVAVNLDKERDSAEAFLKELPADFTIAFDPEGKVADQYEVQGMPSSYVIDRQGRIVSAHLGFREEDTRDMERALRRALGAK